MAKIVFAADTAQFSAPVQKSAGEVRALQSELKKVGVAAKQGFQDAMLAARAAGASTEELQKIQQEYFREQLAIQAAQKQIAAENVAGGKEQISTEEAKRRAVDSVTDALKRQRAEVERQLPVEERHYTPSRQQQASAILRGGGLRAGESFASTIPGFSQFAEIAFPIAGAAALATELYRGVDALVQMDKEAKLVSENIKTGFNDLVAPLQLGTNEIRKQNAELEISIAKLEHKPSNGLALAIAESRIEADKLADSAGKAYEDVKKLLDANQNGFFAQIFLGKGDTGLVTRDVEKGLREYRDLTREYDRQANSGANQAQLSSLRAQIDKREKDLLAYTNTEINKRTGYEETADPGGGRGDTLTNRRFVPYAQLHGSQEENLNTLYGINRFIYATQDRVAVDKTHQQDTNKQKTLESQKQLSAEALAAQKKADEDQRRQWDDQLAADQVNGKRTLDYVVNYWNDKENAARKGSESYLYAEKQGNEALRKLNEENAKNADLGRKLQQDWSEANRIGLTIGGGKIFDEYAKGLGEAAKSANDLITAQRSAANVVALSNVQYQLQQGLISKYDAAVQTATIHELQYQQAVAQLQSQYSAVQAGPNADAQRNRLQQQLTSLNTERSTQILQDQAATAGQTWLGALKQANQLWVQDSEDTAKQVVSIYQSLIGGINNDLSNTLQNIGSRGHRHIGRELSNSLGQTARGIGGQLSNYGLQRLETSALGAFGLGGAKADGSKANPYHVLVDSLGVIPGIGGIGGNVFSGDILKSLGFGGGVPTGSNGGFGSFLGRGSGLLANLFKPSSTSAGGDATALGGNQHNWDIDVDARGANDPAATEAAAKRAVAQMAPSIVAAALFAGKDDKSRLPAMIAALG